VNAERKRNEEINMALMSDQTAQALRHCACARGLVLAKKQKLRYTVVSIDRKGTKEDMKTLLLHADEIEKAAAVIKSGGLVAMPTETVYGLAADALNGEAVAKIFRAKGRPMDNPLIVHISDLSQIRELVREFPEKAQKLAEAFWPGPLTIILPKSDKIPPEVSAGLDTVAIRYPSHPVAHQLIALSVPLAAPSANLSGSPSPTTAQHVMADMNGRIDAVIDGGECSVGVESTVITLACDPPRLLRPGGVTLEELREVLGEVEMDDAVLNPLKSGQQAASPGMKYKHYAPKANVVLLKGNAEAFLRFVNRQNDGKTAVLCYEEDIDELQLPYLLLGKAGDYEAQAMRLFGALREADEKGYTTVYAHCPATQGVGLAVYNRMIRAAGFEVMVLDD